MGRVFGLTLLVIVAVGAIAWFLTGGLRADRAKQYDDEVAAALARDDAATAYRRAQFAAALSKSDERLLTLGSTAFLRRDFAEAADAFAAVDEGSPHYERARVGVAASAANEGDIETYEEALSEARRPADGTLRLALAHAAIDAGRIETVAEILGRDSATNQNEAYARAIAEVTDAPLLASATLMPNDLPFSRAASGSDAYDRFVRQLTFIPEDAPATLRAAATDAGRTEIGTTRKLRLAQALYELKEFRASHALADAAVREQPGYRDAWNALAAAQLALDNLKGAERSLKTSLDIDRADGYTWFLRAELAKRRGDDTASAEYRDKAKLLGYRG